MENPTGFLQSLRDLADNLLGTLKDRVELFSVELQMEKFRLIQLLLWVCVLAVTGLMALLFASFTIVCIFWESGRLVALGVLTALYLGGLVTTVLLFRRYLARQTRPFDGTIEELGADRACTRTNS